MRFPAELQTARPCLPTFSFEHTGACEVERPRRVIEYPSRKFNGLVHLRDGIAISALLRRANQGRYPGSRSLVHHVRCALVSVGVAQQMAWGPYALNRPRH
jgi:hypothetical protein